MRYRLNPRNSYRRQDGLDPNYWKTVDNPDKSWLLGFITTDGHVSSRSVDIQVQPSDQALLERLRTNLNLLPTVKVNSKCARLVISCAEWSRDLRNLGLQSQKSLTAPWIECEDSNDYVRGLFDGDGHIAECKSVPYVVFSSASQPLVNGLVEWMKARSLDPTVSRQEKQLRHPLHRVALYRGQAVPFLKLIYGNKPNLYLDRKMECSQRVVAING